MSARLRLDQVLAGLERHARPTMAGVVRPDSCVAMTWLAVEVLGHFGYLASPLNVELHAVNLQFRQLYEDGEIRLDEPLSEAAIAAGAWSIGLGVESHRQALLAEGKHAVGHVVAVVGAYFVDLSLDQASRPERGMRLWPASFQYSGKVEAGDIWVYEVGGVELSYKLRPDLETWRDSPDWRQGRQRYRRQAGEVIRKMTTLAAAV